MKSKEFYINRCACGCKDIVVILVNPKGKVWDRIGLSTMRALGLKGKLPAKVRITIERVEDK